MAGGSSPPSVASLSDVKANRPNFHASELARQSHRSRRDARRVSGRKFPFPECYTSGVAARCRSWQTKADSRADERLIDFYVLPGASSPSATSSARPSSSPPPWSLSLWRSIMRAAAEDMKRVSLELGGPCPFVVLDDADIEEAAAAATRRSFSNMGQICITVNRILVANSVHSRFLEAMTEATRKIKLGPGTESGVLYGPVLNESVRTRVARHIADGLTEGGKLIGGASARGRGICVRLLLRADPD
jgi:Aldehyde dehydrogenase family